jgi:hypothetical protein
LPPKRLAHLAWAHAVGARACPAQTPAHDAFPLVLRLS